jgi:hypothetical protein
MAPAIGGRHIGNSVFQNKEFQREKRVADASGGERFLDDSADLLLNFPAKRFFHAMAPEACVRD